MSPLQEEVWGFLLGIGAGEVLAYSTVRVLVEYLTAFFSFLPWLSPLTDPPSLWQGPSLLTVVLIQPSLKPHDFLIASLQ